MDINLTKHGVKTENLIFSDSAELPLQTNIRNLHGEEAKKILKCCHNSSVTSVSVSDKSVTAEGTVMLCIIYLDSVGELRSVQHVLPFMRAFEADKPLSDAQAEVTVSEERFSAELTADGGISVNGALKLELCVCREQNEEFICDIDNKNIEQLRGKAEATVKLGRGEKNLIAEEEISIGNGQPSVGQLIRHTAVAVIDETRTISGKVMVKGSVRIYALYIPEEGTRPQSFEDSFPFSQLVEVEGITEDCRSESRVKVLFSDLTPSGGDEIRAFSVAVKLNVSVKAYCDDEIPVLLDAYSTAAPCRVTHKDICFKKLREKHNETFIATKTFEFTDGAVGSVIDMWCDIKNYSHRFEDGVFKLNGTARVNLLAYDCDGVPVCYERSLDFEHEHIPEVILCEPEADYVLTVAHCSYTITGANTFSISVEPRLELSVYDKVRQKLLVDICEDETAGEGSSVGSSIVLYFAEVGESLWDIARRYNSSVGEIKALNSITEDILTRREKFIIPTK